MTETAQAKNGGVSLGLEAEVFKATGRLRGNMEPADYKHIVLGLIFLKQISDGFDARQSELLAENPDRAEDPNAYAEVNLFWLPKEARWLHLRASSKESDIGELVDEAMAAIERENTTLKDVLPKNYCHPELNPILLGKLIDLIASTTMGKGDGNPHEAMSQMYEYFLCEFADREGKRCAEHYTPRSIVRTAVEMLRPLRGRVYDPCCRSGGMLVQAHRLAETRNGKSRDIAVYGQERNYTAWRQCKMNLAAHRISGEVRWNSMGSIHRDELADLSADCILANPPFSFSDGWGKRPAEDSRWKYGVPGSGDDNFAWLQHILHHLSPGGRACAVLTNGSLSTSVPAAGQIRKAMVEDGVVDCIVAMPGQLYYSTQIPVCLWLMKKAEKGDMMRSRQGELLFIDAWKMGVMGGGQQREFADAEIEVISGTYHRWREGRDYKDIPNFCRAAGIEEIRRHGYDLAPARYVGGDGAEQAEDRFVERLSKLHDEIDEQLSKEEDLAVAIRQQLAAASGAEGSKNA